MNETASAQLSREDLARILAVTRALAAPFDLAALLREVTLAAARVLRAERASVWLYDAARDELVVHVADDIHDIRIPAGTGLVGACARSRAPVNVPDCYADPRFDPSTDRRSGFRTRCSLSLPLIDHRDALVGVMQVINREGGVFGTDDEALAQALAAQCAVALTRARMTAAAIEGERLKREMELARVVQTSSLPAAMPAVAGYDLHGEFLPAEATGGDTYDLAPLAQGVLVVLGDATGHGIAPALAVTQMHAMLRMALQLGTPLEEAVRAVNNALARTLPDEHFVTAFVGLLDPVAHRLAFVSGGQAPILLHRAADDAVESYGATSFPLGALPLAAAKPATVIDLAPGDLLAVLSDGVYEAENGQGEQYGRPRVEALLRASHGASAAAVASRLLAEVRAFVGAAGQGDDVTMVLVRRLPA